MKKTIGIVGVIMFCLLISNAHAQTPDPQETKPQQTWDPMKNPTVVAITSQFEGKYITSHPVSTEADIFPVIGQYESATNSEAPSVSIMLDEENKGMAWIDGLPQGRIKALLRKSPATYKIPAQKTEEGKEVAEGTLLFDKETNTLNICIGKPFNDADPAATFLQPQEEPAVTANNSKSKKAKTVQQPKPWMYTGTKLVTETAANLK